MVTRVTRAPALGPRQPQAKMLLCRERVLLGPGRPPPERSRLGVMASSSPEPHTLAPQPGAILVTLWDPLCLSFPTVKRREARRCLRLRGQTQRGSRVPLSMGAVRRENTPRPPPQAPRYSGKAGHGWKLEPTHRDPRLDALSAPGAGHAPGHGLAAQTAPRFPWPRVVEGPVLGWPPAELWGAWALGSGRGQEGQSRRRGRPGVWGAVGGRGLPCRFSV